MRSPKSSEERDSRVTRSGAVASLAKSIDSYSALASLGAMNVNTNRSHREMQNFTEREFKAAANIIVFPVYKPRSQVQYYQSDESFANFSLNPSASGKENPLALTEEPLFYSSSSSASINNAQIMQVPGELQHSGDGDMSTLSRVSSGKKRRFYSQVDVSSARNYIYRIIVKNIDFKSVVVPRALPAGTAAAAAATHA